MATIDIEKNETLEKVQGFWTKNSKIITYVGGAIILLAASWIGYNKLIKEPKELAASESIFMAENIFDKMSAVGFNKDSVNIVLNGGNIDGMNVTGLIKIINSNGDTKAGNRAKYMAGACYLQTSEFDKAIKFLKDFDGNNASQVQSKAYVMLGHAYSEKKQTKEAMEYYEKAATVNEKDEAITPDALMLCANYAEVNNMNKEAVDFLKKVKQNFPTYISVSNGEVDKHLARLGEFE